MEVEITMKRNYGFNEETNIDNKKGILEGLMLTVFADEGESKEEKTEEENK